jgi:hypothetical protein
MTLHSLPHRNNGSLVSMWAGVALIPAGFLMALFLLAHFV